MTTNEKERKELMDYVFDLANISRELGAANNWQECEELIEMQKDVIYKIKERIGEPTNKDTLEKHSFLVKVVKHSEHVFPIEAYSRNDAEEEAITKAFNYTGWDNAEESFYVQESCSDDNPSYIKHECHECANKPTNVNKPEPISYSDYEQIKTVDLYCPCCKKKVPVAAEMYNLQNYTTNVIEDSLGQVKIDWDNASVHGDFVYVCPDCHKMLAADLDEVKELYVRSEYEKRA